MARKKHCKLKESIKGNITRERNVQKCTDMKVNEITIIAFRGLLLNFDCNLYLWILVLICFLDYVVDCS